VDRGEADGFFDRMWSGGEVESTERKGCLLGKASCLEKRGGKCKRGGHRQSWGKGCETDFAGAIHWWRVLLASGVAGEEEKHGSILRKALTAAALRFRLTSGIKKKNKPRDRGRKKSPPL